MKKFISKVKYNSCMIIPLCIAVIITILNWKLKLLDNVTETKIDSLIGIVGALIGVLITVLTVYVSFPKNSEHMIRVRQSGHHHIFVSNIDVGIILFTICILLWLFSIDKNMILILFLSGLSNTIIGAYYISYLTRYS